MNIQIKQIIILGDSSVYGWGDPVEGGWCERVRKSFMNVPSAPIIYPLGIRGDGLERVSKRWRQEWSTRGELRRKSPEAILISVGLNDTAHIGRRDGRPQLSSDAYQFGLKQLLKEIKSYTKVFVLGLTPVEESAMPFAECLWYLNHDISIYESKIEETCLELNVPFLPIHKCMISEPYWRNWLEPDGIHLNSEGHYWLYQKIMQWKSFLEFVEIEPINTVTYTNY